MVPPVWKKNEQEETLPVSEDVLDRKKTVSSSVFLDEIWFEILKFLPIQSVPAISRLSKKLNIIQNSETIWRVYADCLKIKIAGELHPKKQVEIDRYRRDNPLFTALEQVFPYQMYSTLPHSKKFMPKGFDLVSGWNLEIEKNQMYIKLREKLSEIPIIKFNKNYIFMNIEWRNDKGEAVKKELHISYKNNSVEIIIGTREQFDLDEGMIIQMLCISPEDYEFAIKYLKNLINGDRVGYPYLDMSQGNDLKYIETSKKVIELVSNNDLTEIKNLAKNLQFEKPQWYL